MNIPSDLKTLSNSDLAALCDEIRKIILNTVSHTGGHLSSNLGAVELTVAMHAVFDSAKDPFIFDVSHQCYTHKILTNRLDRFDSLRQFKGISGYTKPSESSADYFIAGHSSTSISLAVGAAKSIALKNEQNSRIPVAIIGDGALTGGMAYEALNELGERKYPCVIILNDNEMSISTPIGAISRYLSQMMAGPAYQAFKARINRLLSYAPEAAAYMAKRLEEGIRLITPGMLFEELGLEYIGPVDGHDIGALISALKTAKTMNKPVIVHATTIKGKGYAPAEGKFEKWHGVAPFCLIDDDSSVATSQNSVKNLSATQIFSNALLNLAKKHENIVGVTAAMPSGTGMDALIKAFANRFWDVAICEQHAVTSMAAMAKEGFKPYIAIYSTFLQRAYDQVIHDCAIMALPVVFCIDRAGIVGEDGETHQGLFDISYLNAVPNMHLAAPRCKRSFEALMEFSYSFDKPLAIRYPRGSFAEEVLSEFETPKIELGKSQLLKSGDADTLFIGYGAAVATAIKTANELRDKLDPAILDLVFAKPLDEKMLLDLAGKYKKWFIFSDSAKKGGVGEILAGFLQANQINSILITSFEIADIFVPHGHIDDISSHLNISPAHLAKWVLSV